MLIVYALLAVIVKFIFLVAAAAGLFCLFALVKGDGGAFLGLAVTGAICAGSYFSARKLNALIKPVEEPGQKEPEPQSGVRRSVPFGIAFGLGTLVLLVIALPKLANLIRKSGEGSVKGNLGALKGALAVYYGENQGMYPVDDLASLTLNGKYMQNIPPAMFHPFHERTVLVHVGTKADDTGGWMYDNASTDVSFGSLWMNCTHTDDKGTRWNEY